MDVLNGIFLLIVGLGVMAFGLMIFYAILPLFYAFFGFGVGYWLGSLLTSVAPGEFSLTKSLFAFGGAIVFAFAAYALESYRRILVGIGMGSLFGGLIASALGLRGFFGVAIMVAAGVVGAMAILAVFDPFVIATTALGGAGLAMDGLHLILPWFGLVDRATIGQGGLVPFIIWMALGGLAIGWQYSNIERWVVQAPDKKPPQ